jgi:hypothetical protein
MRYARLIFIAFVLYTMSIITLDRIQVYTNSLRFSKPCKLVKASNPLLDQCSLIFAVYREDLSTVAQDAAGVQYQSTIQCARCHSADSKGFSSHAPTRNISRSKWDLFINDAAANAQTLACAFPDSSVGHEVLRTVALALDLTDKNRIIR